MPQTSSIATPAFRAPAFLGSAWRKGKSLFAGVWLAAIVSLAAYHLKSWGPLSAFSPMILGILLGVVLSTFAPLPAAVQPGLKFTSKTLLRFCVALLGLQVTFTEIAQGGVWGLASAALALVSTFALTLFIGKKLGVSRDLSTLIAAGTSICGASAIAGANGALRAKEEDVAYALASITLFGTLALFLYPLLGAWSGLSGNDYGRWIGLSVHEVSQVVGAGFQGGDAAGRAAVVAKLSRVILLGGVIFWLAQRVKTEGSTQARPPLVPFFLIGFLLLAAVNSLGFAPSALAEPVVRATPILLTLALSALGLGTNLRSLLRLGWRPLLLCGIATAFIAVLSRILVVF